MIGGADSNCIVLAIAVSALLTTLMGLALVLSIEIIALSFGVSAGIGVLFGFVPAKRAAHRNPIEALRDE